MTSHTKVSLSYPLAESEICLIEQLNTLCRGEKTCSSLSAANMFKSPKLKQHSPPSLHNAAVSLGASHSPCAQDSGKHWPNRVVQRIRPKRQVPTSLLPTKRQWKKSTMTHLSLWCSIRSCFLQAETLVPCVSPLPPDSQQKNHRMMPTYFSFPSQMSPWLSRVLLSHSPTLSYWTRIPDLFGSLV